MNHIRMDSLYDKLEQLIFLRKYSHYNTKASTMSYDLYLAGVKKQNAIFEKEMEELRTSKFTVEIENYYSQILQKHEQELVILQSEIDRVENTHLIYTPAQSQQSA